MTREAAIHIAQQAVNADSISDYELPKAMHENQNGKWTWVVIFALKAEEGVVMSPDSIFVEVDEETKIAKVILGL